MLKRCTMDEHMKFYCESAEAEYNVLSKVELFINSLQEEPVSEDLEKEISDYLTSYHLHIEDGGRIVFDNNDSPNFMCDIRHIAKYFFDLGLKARGGK